MGSAADQGAEPDDGGEAFCKEGIWREEEGPRRSGAEGDGYESDRAVYVSEVWPRAAVGACGRPDLQEGRRDSHAVEGGSDSLLGREWREAGGVDRCGERE